MTSRLYPFLLSVPLSLSAIETSIPVSYDTWLRGTGGASNNNTGAGEVLIGNINSSTVGRGVFEFDLTPYSLAAGDSILSARIKLTVSFNDSSTTSNPGNLPLNLRPVDDGGETADLINGTTWTNRSLSGPASWSTAGGVYGTQIGSGSANPFTLASNDTVTVSFSDLSPISLGSSLQLAILSPDAENLGGTRALFRFHSAENSVGDSVKPTLILETNQALIGSPPVGDLNVGGTTEITSDTTVPNILLGSSTDGTLSINGGNLTATNNFSSGTSAPFRDGILNLLSGSLSIGGDSDFSGNALSASVLRIWNPGQNPAIATVGHLTLGRVVLMLPADSSYSHTTNSVHTLMTYASRTGHFENVPRDGIISHGINRFRIDYDVNAGNGLLSVTATALPNYTRPASQPNLIFIMVDDQGYSELTPYGGPANRHPNLSALASQGLLCTSGYSVASVCSPTRGGLLTGRNCESVGHRQNIGGGQEGQGLSPTFRTHMQRLASVGYRNYWVGKWYAGTSAEKDPLQRGVDQFFTISDGLSHSAGNDQLAENGVPLGATTQYLTDHMGDQAITYISDHLTNYPSQPFHLHWSDYAPHSPFTADPADLQALFGNQGSYSTAQRIAAMNLAIDRNVGKLLDFLDDPDGNPATNDSIADNTLIVYTNDNGGTGSHNNGPLRGSKGFQYEGGIRVPMIVRWSNRISPATFDQPAHMNDWIATFCSVAGVPNHERSQLDGLDLMPILDGTAPYPTERELFWNLWPRWLDKGQMAGGMRRDNWKLIVSEDLSVTELYNLDTDLGESNNVKNANPAIHDSMFASYRQWQRTNLTPQWQEGFNPNILARDSGLYLRAIHNGYRLTNRASTPLYFTTETRPFVNLQSDFQLVTRFHPRSASDLTSNSQAWLAFGFSAPTNVTAPPSPPSRSELTRLGIDYNTLTLILEDLDSGISSSQALPASWIPSSATSIALSYESATRTLTASTEGISTSLTLPNGNNEWQHLGFGVTDSEVEFSILRDTTSYRGASLFNPELDSQTLTFEFNSSFPSGQPLQLEHSTDLRLFTPFDDALIEYLTPSRARIFIEEDPSLQQHFFRVGY